jgi:flagellar basal-body rod modification protein FlgD
MTIPPTAASGTAGAAPASSLNLSTDQFLKLLTTQLQYQDPSNPISSQDFLSQLAQFSTLSGVQTLNTNSSNMLMLQQMTQGANLIGRTVTYQAPNTKGPQQGLVTAINVQNGTLNLVVQGTNVPINQLQGIVK